MKLYFETDQPKDVRAREEGVRAPHSLHASTFYVTVGVAASHCAQGDQAVHPLLWRLHVAERVRSQDPGLYPSSTVRGGESYGIQDLFGYRHDKFISSVSADRDV